jgi:uncharacterized protein DUF1707
MPEIRIGDAERTAAARELGEHFAQGRLTADEHQERLDRVMSARTASELTPLFTDLPGSRYQAQRAYAAADRPAVGSDIKGDRPRGGRPYPGPPFGRPPFGRPPMTRGRSWFGVLPFPAKLLLVLLVAAVVITHLPLILIGLVVWFVLARTGVCGPRAYQRR